MGKGNSSDIYTYNVTKHSGRKFTIVITPTTASSIELPYLDGVAAVILGILWEQIPFEIRYRKLLEDPNRPRGDTWSMNGMDITEWWLAKRATLPEADREDTFGSWERESETVRRALIEKHKESNRLQQIAWLKLIEEKRLPPLAELSVEDVCSNMKFSWKYVQHVRLVQRTGVSESEDRDRAVKNPVTGTYDVLMTTERWLRGLQLNSGDRSGGTTAYERPSEALPAWRPELNLRGYAPTAFTLRLIVLLIMRLRRHAPNHLSMLPADVFWLIVSALWRSSHEEADVPNWEVTWLAARRQRQLQKS